MTATTENVAPFGFQHLVVRDVRAEGNLDRSALAHQGSAGVIRVALLEAAVDRRMK